MVTITRRAARREVATAKVKAKRWAVGKLATRSPANPVVLRSHSVLIACVSQGSQPHTARAERALWRELSSTEFNPSFARNSLHELKTKTARRRWCVRRLPYAVRHHSVSFPCRHTFVLGARPRPLLFHSSACARMCRKRLSLMRAGLHVTQAREMAATITISARDESDGLQSCHDALLEVTPVPSDALFVVPGDEIPVDMDSGFLKCGRAACALVACRRTGDGTRSAPTARTCLNPPMPRLPGAMGLSSWMESSWRQHAASS